MGKQPEKQWYIQYHTNGHHCMEWYQCQKLNWICTTKRSVNRSAKCTESANRSAFQSVVKLVGLQVALENHLIGSLVCDW